MAALNRPDLVVDATGVGVGVVQMLRCQELSTFRVKVDYTPQDKSQICRFSEKNENVPLWSARYLA